MLGASRLVLPAEPEFAKPARKESRERSAVFRLSKEKLILLKALVEFTGPIRGLRLLLYLEKRRYRRLVRLV